LSTDFLKQLQAVQAEYRFRVSRSVLRGGYAGGGWRGALGRAFLPALCQEHPTAEPGDHPCLSQGCARPAECSYFSLFERDRDQSGENIPKPYVLGLPVDPAVRELLSGTNLPESFRIRRDGILEKTQSTLYLPDQEISLCILWVGSIAVVEPAATQHLRSNGLDCGGGKLELEGVAWRNYLPASSLPVGTNRLRINFLTPFCTRSDDSNLEAIALRLPHVALVRAMKLFENFSGPVALRLPFQSFPEGALRLLAVNFIGTSLTASVRGSGERFRCGESSAGWRWKGISKRLGLF